MFGQIRNRATSGLIIIGLSVGLGACGGDAAPTAAPTSVPTAALASTVAPTSQSSGELRPLTPLECEELRVLASGALVVPFTPSEAPFLDYISGKQGTGCDVTATGTGETLNNVGELAQTLRVALTSAGWIENQAYAADGPTGTSFAVEKGAALVLVSAGWEPAPGSDCPPDQPISACEIPAAQQIYTITLSGAQR